MAYQFIVAVDESSKARCGSSKLLLPGFASKTFGLVTLNIVATNTDQAESKQLPRAPRQDVSRNVAAFWIATKQSMRVDECRTCIVR